MQINRGADLDSLSAMIVTGSPEAKALFRRCFPPSDRLTGTAGRA